MLSHTSAWLVVAVLAASLGGCAATEEGAAPSGTWVTRIAGEDAWLGITVATSEAAAFVCGGPSAIETHTRWMLSSATTAEVTFVKDGWTLDVDLTHQSAAGQLTDPMGAAVAFDAQRTPEDSVAGLYYGFDSGCGDGLIVLSDTEALGAWCDANGLRAQVTPVTPIERTSQGLAASVEIAGGRRDFFMNVANPATVTP